MTRTELREALKAKGIFDINGSRDDLWAQAFRLHFQETRKKLSQSCGSCYRTLRNWMNS